jgi:hypothetical protein
MCAVTIVDQSFVKSAILTFSLLVVSCARGPAIGTINGRVTLDNQPVDGGLIRLVPADGNSQPADCIIKGGSFSISMPVGEKKVEIYWTKGGGGKVDTATQGTEQVIQMIPPKYNTQTELTCTIEQGTVVKDFALTR